MRGFHSSETVEARWFLDKPNAHQAKNKKKRIIDGHRLKGAWPCLFDFVCGEPTLPQQPLTKTYQFFYKAFQNIWSYGPLKSTNGYKSPITNSRLKVTFPASIGRIGSELCLFLWSTQSSFESSIGKNWSLKPWHFTIWIAISTWKTLKKKNEKITLV